MIFSHVTPNNYSVALCDKKSTWTYRELYHNITNVQSRLLSFSLDKTVGLVPSKSNEHIAIFLALLGLGKSVCLFSEDSNAARLNTARNNYGIKAIISSASLSFEIHTKDLFCETKSSHKIFDKLEIASTLIFSSGSSNKPKLISSPITAHIQSAKNAIKALKIQEDSKYLLSLPLDHVSGIAPIFRTLISGATLVIDYNFNQDPVKCISFHKISHLSCVQTQLKRLLENHSKTLVSLKALLLGGSHIPIDLVRKAYEKKLPIFLSYGMTETNSMICCNNVLESKNFRSCGKPFENVSVSISDTSELLISSPVLFKSYISCKTKINSRSDPFKTSDIGHLDSNQNLYITGRSDDIFISGGYNINPQEIEDKLESFEGIEKVKVLPADHEDFGQSPIAFYFSKFQIDEKLLYHFLKKHLKFYQLPKSIVYWEFKNLDKGKITLFEKKRMLDHFNNIYK